jgi:hypothetical protein
VESLNRRLRVQLINWRDEEVREKPIGDEEVREKPIGDEEAKGGKPMGDKEVRGRE